MDCSPREGAESIQARAFSFNMMDNLLFTVLSLLSETSFAGKVTPAASGSRGGVVKVFSDGVCMKLK